MAVIDAIPGLEVSVQTLGQKAHEYHDPDPADDPEYPDTKQAHCYIESKDGEEYSIEYIVHPTYPFPHPVQDYALVFVVRVDGKWVRSMAFRGDDKTVPHHIRGKKEAVSGTWMERRFKFSPITTTDEADTKRVAKDVKAAAQLGLIQVVIELGRVTSITPESSRSRANSTVPNHQFDFSEKALKGQAISHGTGFSAPVPYRFGNKVRRDKIAVIAVFNFRYRSKHALQHEMIAPRIPSLSPSGINDMPREEIERLAQERLRQLRDVKNEDKTTVKKEAKRHFDEIIDLTSDDDGSVRSAKVVKRKNGQAVIDLTDD